MGFDFRYPNITGTTEREQMTQFKGYLIQLVDQLNWAMNNISSQTPTAYSTQSVPASRISASASQVSSLGRGKANIPSGADLNNYKEFGVYNITSNSHAENIANCPYPKAGRLIVSSGTGDGKQSGSWAYILQEYISFDGKYKFYRLIYTGATADEWIYNKWECRSDKFWEALGLSSAVSQSNSAFGRYQNGNVWYRVVNENHIYVSFNCAFTFNGDPIQVNSSPIPSPYKPTRNVYAMCPVNNRGIARILVNPDGNIIIDYVQSMEVGEVTSTYTVNWVDGYIDYWV